MFGGMLSKFNRATVGHGPVSPLVSKASPVARTYNMAPGALPDSKTELFKLGVNLFAGNESTFYENGKVRDKRFTDLVEKLAVADPSWTAAFLKWLRSDAYIRTASIIGAAHFVHARLNDANSVEEDTILSGLDYSGINRHVIDQVCQRADEPGELKAYYSSTFGSLPKPVKRGLGDAANRLYSEYSVMKYDTDSHPVRFANILNLTHVQPKYIPWTDTSDFENEEEFIATAAVNKQALFKYILDRVYDNEVDYRNLPMITANKQFRKDAAEDPKVILDATRVKAAGMTWEALVSMAGTKLPKNKVWEAIIPSMGIMALIRNLRNFEEAGISKDSQNYIISKITDSKVIAKSRQLPFRFLSAYKNVNSLHYKAALETAIDLSCQNVPVLDGKTLVLCDLSGSMDSRTSDHSDMSRREVAALFAAILANRNPHGVTVVAYGNSSKIITMNPGESILPFSQRITALQYQVGGGTNTYGAVRDNYVKGGHKRVIIITDEQTSYNPYSYSRARSSGSASLGDLCYPKTWMYSFNLAGYKVSQMETGQNRRYQLGGLTDTTFKQIPWLEMGLEAKWPWEYSKEALEVVKPKKED